ncbi:MAG: HEAT repeat domain-containing protein [Candidatus Aminicenantes bacterium]|nr:HEAT repeat domain-containing protein [Candidatus Aminicenantes bacterium]
MTGNPDRGFVGFIVSIILILSAAACSPEKKAWETAEKGGAVFSYESYLVEYPQGEHSAAAKLKIEEFDYQQALGEATRLGDGKIGPLQEFLKQYPEGAFAAKARERIDNLEWESGAAKSSIVSYEDYLTAYPQGRHADEARAWIKAALDARPAEFRDVRMVKFVLRQSFDEEVKDVTIGFEAALKEFFPYVGLRLAGPNDTADAVISVNCQAKAYGASYSQFGLGEGTYYYTGAQVSGQAVLQVPGKKTLREDFDGEVPIPYTLSGGTTEASGAPFNGAMEKDFPRKAARLLARAFGYAPMIGALSNSRYDVLPAAIYALESGGAAALDLLLPALAGPDAGVRTGAARALAGHKTAPVVAALIKGLEREGQNELVFRNAAAESLSEMGALAVPALTEAQKDARPAVRAGAAMALAGIRTAPSLALLAGLLDDAEISVRTAAIEAIGEHRTRAGVLILIERLGAEKADNRDAYLAAIGKSMEVNVSDDETDSRPPALDWDRDLATRLVKTAPLMAGNGKQRDILLDIVAQIGESASPAVAQALRADSAAVRAWAAEAAGKMTDSGMARTLAQAAGDADSTVRLAVAKSLAGSPDVGAIEPLGRLLLDPSEEIRMEAIRGLQNAIGTEGGTAAFRRHLSSPDKVKVLVEALSFSDPKKTDRRDAASGVLGEIGRPAVEPLIAVLKGADRTAWPGAAGALGKSGGDQAVAALIELAGNPAAQSDDVLMTRLYTALGETKSLKALDILAAGLKEASRERKRTAIEGLKTLGHIRGADALAASLPTGDAGLDSDVHSALQELTKYEPEDENFDWKAWWAKNRARYGLK